MVGKLSKEGFSTAEIGLKLRDSYGIPSVKLATGKAVAAMVRDAGLAPDLPEDLSNLMRKAVRLGEHLESNRKDVHNRRALQLTESKILRLVRYYKRNSVLPDDWKYTLANAKLLVG